MVEEEAAEVVAAEAAAEIEEETAVVSPAPADRRLGVRHRPNPGTQGPSIRTCQQENGKGVKCILNGAEIVISVANPLRVHGRTSTPQDHSNETGTSPVLHKISYFSILYTKTNTFRKYME